MGKTRIIDRGWGKFLKDLNTLDNSATKVGLPEEGNPAGPDSMSEEIKIGIYNEFGTEIDGVKRIPERPFISGAFDKHKEELKQMIDGEYVAVVHGQRNPREALGRVGAWLASKTQVFMDDMKDPSNAQSTIDKKGDDNPLVDTGNLKQTIQHVEVIHTMKQISQG